MSVEDAAQIFLSTPSARRATCVRPAGCSPYSPISIHALREEGDQIVFMTGFCYSISIHALREEGDRHGHGRACHSPAISIHALREEGDSATGGGNEELSHFYPRPPRGGRRS
mgnify:CR=1 FL=1